MTSTIKKCKKGTVVAFTDVNGQFRTGVIKRTIKRGRNKGKYRILPTAYDSQQTIPKNQIKEVLA